MSVYCLVSKFTVNNNSSDFEAEYGRTGAWFKFFEPCEDFLGHDLMKSEEKNTYLLIYKWMSKEDYQLFLKNHQTEHDQLIEQSKSLYDTMDFLGDYELRQ